MLGILELLIPRGLDPKSRTKIVRHQDKRYDVHELERKGLLDLYQGYQSKPVFECDYIISFLGLESSRARFHGVFRVVGKTAASDRPLPADFEYPGFANPNGYFYDLTPVTGFEDLIGRVVIHWG